MSVSSYEYISPRRRKLVFSPHPGQARALLSDKQIVLVLAGTQGGKTVTGPYWLFREIKLRGPGDYLVVAPTFPLLDKKAIPEFRKLFEDELTLGKYVGGSRQVFNVRKTQHDRLFRDTPYAHEEYQPTRILFGHAQDADSLESMTAKAAWLDEAGQKKFRLASYEAINRRLNIHLGRQFITTTPYNLGWLKTELHDRALAGDDKIEIVRFRSIDNPTFPRAAWDRARDTLPAWKFDLFYRAIFTRPAGIIYDSFLEEDIVQPFPIPDHWRRYVGIDFGAVNTAALFYAHDPRENVFYLYREYWPRQKRTAAAHADTIRKGEPPFLTCFGGAPSEDQWRDEFDAAGLTIDRPEISDVEVGIDRVYAAHRLRRIRVFNSCRYYLDEKGSYSRKLDDLDQPTEEIEDKNAFHLMDAERYVISSTLDVDNDTSPVDWIDL